MVVVNMVYIAASFADLSIVFGVWNIVYLLCVIYMAYTLYMCQLKTSRVLEKQELKQDILNLKTINTMYMYLKSQLIV